MVFRSTKAEETGELSLIDNSYPVGQCLPPLIKKKKNEEKGEKEETKKITEKKKVSLLRRFQDHETKGLITNQIRSQPNPLQPPNPEPNFSRREGKGKDAPSRWKNQVHLSATLANSRRIRQ